MCGVRGDYAEEVKAWLCVSLSCVVAVLACAQTPSARLPRFEDYPVTERFTGEPASPILDWPEELKFQTVIREGVSKGWGV